MTGKTNEKGFTLVEVIVVGVLVIVLALGAYSFFMMYLNESREASTHLRMQRQAEGLFDEMGRVVRESHRVTRPGDMPATYKPDSTWPVVDATTPLAQAQTLFCYNDAGTITHRYRFRSANNRLFVEDSGTAAGWQPFRIGGDSIILSSDAEERNFFGLNDKRTEVNVNITLRQSTFNLRFDGRRFRCRVTDVH